MDIPPSFPPSNHPSSLLIASSFSVWYFSVPSRHDALQSFIRANRANLFEPSQIGETSLRSRRVSSCPLPASFPPEE